MLVRTGWSEPSAAQRTVAEVSAVLAKLRLVEIAKWKKEWADYPSNKEKSA